MILKKLYIYAGFMAIAGCLFASYSNNNLFMDQLLASSGILACVLLIKLAGKS